LYDRWDAMLPTIFFLEWWLVDFSGDREDVGTLHEVMSLVPFVFIRSHRKTRKNTREGLPVSLMRPLDVLCLNVLPSERRTKFKRP